MIKFLLVLFIHLASCTTQNGENKPELTGKVVSVSDGDTFKLLLADKTLVKVRLFGIDAPEKGQDFSNSSKEFLASLIQGRTIRVVNKGRDKYGRTLGNVYTNSGDLVNLDLVNAGMAWHFTRYSNDPVLANAEKNARNHRLGLWQQPNPLAPWEYRNLRKKTPKN